MPAKLQAVQEPSARALTNLYYFRSIYLTTGLSAGRALWRKAGRGKRRGLGSAGG